MNLIVPKFPANRNRKIYLAPNLLLCTITFGDRENNVLLEKHWWHGILSAHLALEIGKMPCFA